MTRIGAQRPSAPSPERCALCRLPIAPDQAPYVYEDNVLCESCYVISSRATEEFEAVARSPSPPQPRQIQTCANCGSTIGKLETTQLYQEHVVCGACYSRLSAQVPAEPIGYATPRTVAAAPAGPVSFHNAHGPPIICPNPNCGYTGPSERKSKGSAVMMILLLLLWVLPGLIYAFVYNGHVLSCPNCGIKIRDD
jgi:hypothetical protein